METTPPARDRAAPFLDDRPPRGPELPQEAVHGPSLREEASPGPSPRDKTAPLPGRGARTQSPRSGAGPDPLLGDSQVLDGNSPCGGPRTRPHAGKAPGVRADSSSRPSSQRACTPPAGKANALLPAPAPEAPRAGDTADVYRTRPLNIEGPAGLLAPGHLGAQNVYLPRRRLLLKPHPQSVLLWPRGLAERPVRELQGPGGQLGGQHPRQLPT